MMNKIATPPPNAFYPAVSVIIPMYNAEKYIAECLDSILAQTFQNFELIVVDDCSTDNSAAIVESYIPKFGGRLILSHMKKNSGGPGAPSNMGIDLSRGEYLLILDNDDTITQTALSELYSIAKYFNADVVGCEKYYSVPEQLWYNTEFRKQIEPFTYQNGDYVTESTLLTADFAERVQQCNQRRFLWNIWSKLIRRDFLKKNRIYFVQNMIQDFLFTCCLIYTAERYVRVPNVVNNYRELKDSLSHKSYSHDEYLLKYTHALTTGIKYLDDFLDDHEFFRQHANFKYLALEIYMNEILNYTTGIYYQVPAPLLDGILRKEFHDGENNALLTLLFSTVNIHRLLLWQSQQRIAKLESELKRKVD